MTTQPLAQLLTGPFSFLDPGAVEIQTLFPNGLTELPVPYPIYLEDETATPFHGFPVLLSDHYQELRDALESYLEAEEVAQLNALRREPFSRSTYLACRERYLRLLGIALEHSMLSSYGRHFPALFWLHHSMDVARRLRDAGKRLVRQDAELGKRFGEQVRYRVFEKYREQVGAAVLALMSRLASELDEDAEPTLPRLLKRMFDNVLAFTEEHVSSDLGELNGYLSVVTGLDPKDFRQRFERLAEWHAQEIGDDFRLRAMASQILGVEPGAPPRRMLYRPRYVTFLTSRETYDARNLLSPRQVEVWEQLLWRLKEFELLNALRRLVLPVRQEGGRLIFRAGGLDRTWVGQRFITLSPATRPLDFMSPSVIDPLIHRFGLIYDISEFSAVVSHLRRAGTDVQEKSFRQMFRFQRQMNRLAGTYRLQLEKYLGDGAFYTSRQPLNLLLCAIHLQRLYRRALRDGLPFDQGMRIGLNFGHYRLFPISDAASGEPDRYEFFGHGVVELSRLTSGKSTEEIAEIKNVLVNYGYPPATVEKFFGPLAGRNLDVVDQQEQSRAFFAYINRNGSLINEGIVATEEFVLQLSDALGEVSCHRGELVGRPYVVVALPDQEGQLFVGARRLGIAHLKGLDDLPVYEIVDGLDLEVGALTALPENRLLAAIEKLASTPAPAPARREAR